MSWDAWLRLWRWGNAVALLGVLQFAICLYLAMRLYPGGTPLDHDTAGYSFYGNVLFACVGWYLLFSARMLRMVESPVPVRESVVDEEAIAYLRRLRRME